MTYKKLLVLLGSTILMNVGSSAFAQNVDEIIVTGARGRQENVQQVPLSETVFNEAAILDARIDQVDDFLALTPGVTFSNSQDAGTNFISIRGLSQTRNGEPPVAVIVDDVLQTNSRTFDQPLFDVASVEVLRGPQGALYGRNATGGAIIITTKQPTNEVEGYVQATIGEGNEYAVEGSISGPIVEDKLLYRVSGRYLDRGGYFDNTVLGEKVDYVEDLALRGHLKYFASDTVTLDLRGSMIRTNAGSLNYTYQPAIIDPSTGLPSAFDFTILDADLVSRDFYANNLGLDDRDVDQLSLRINADLGFANLRLVSAYDKVTQSTGSDQFPYSAASTVTAAPPFPFYDGIQSQYFDIRTLSQEIRLTSKDEEQFRWMVGGYYLDTNRFVSSSIMDDLEQGIIRIERDPVINTSNPLTSFIADDNDNTAWALFFNAAYDITDKFEVAFAGRYDEDKREQTVDARQGAYTAGVLSAPIGSPGNVNTATFNLFQPKISLRYLASENVTFYASWGKGFRSGQFNQNGVGTLAAGAGVAGVGDLYPQEETQTFELGGKLSWLDGRVTTNGAVYSTKVENAPYFVFIGAVSAQVLVPIDEIDVVGGELEIKANLADGLDAYFGVGITDSEIKAYSVDSSVIGNKAPYIANSTLNAGLQYRRPVTESLGLFARVDYEKRGEQFWDPENTTSRSSVNLVNLRFGVEDLDGKWALTVSGDNVGDEVYNSEWVSGGYAHTGLPSVWRVDLRVNF